MENASPLQSFIYRITHKFMTLFLGCFFAALVISIAFVCLFKMTESVAIEGVLVPAKYAVVRPEVSGIVRSVFVEEGTLVSKNQVLVELDDDAVRGKVRADSIGVEILRGNLLRAQKELAAMQATNRNSWQQAQLRLKQARMELDDQIQIFEAENQILTSGAIASRNSPLRKEPYNLRLKRLALEQADLALEAARQQLATESIKATEVENAAKEFAKGQEELRRTLATLEKEQILAPQEGYVIGSDIHEIEGTSVVEGQPLFSVGTVSEWTAEALLTEQDLPKVKPGLQAKLYLRAYPYDKYRLLIGEVLRVSVSPTPSGVVNIANDLTPGRRLYTAVIGITDSGFSSDEKSMRLYSGLHAQIKVVTNRERIIKLILEKVFSSARKLKYSPEDLPGG